METQHPSGKQDKQYVENRRHLASGEEEKHLALARSPDTAPEMLFYLGENGSEQVRAAVAENPASPQKIDLALSEDEAEQVRGKLALKISRLLKDCGEDEVCLIVGRIEQTLLKLARDHQPRIRQILAEELKASERVPRKVVDILARDEEDAVACPILRYSPLLTDTELSELVAAGLVESRLKSVAGRETVSKRLADAIVDTLEIPAVAELLVNKGADIREETMAEIVEMARATDALHGPLADNPNLSIRLMRRIAGFIAVALTDRMVEVHGVNPEEAQHILKRSRARIADEKFDADDTESVEQVIGRLDKAGVLDDEALRDAIEGRKKSLALAMLAHMADVPPEAVETIIATKDGRAITALAHKAGLEMRTALIMQSKLAYVSGSKFLSAKGGTDYPESPARLARALDPILSEYQ